MMELFEIPAQCCDAKHYLAMGQACAESGECYNILRPMGAVYWFSIPYRFNFPLDILVILHFLLAAISVLLSVLTIKNIISLPGNKKNVSGYKILITLLLFSALLHGIFLYPVIHHSLSDPPSNLLFLIAIWLLFLLPQKIIPQIITLLISGMLLGIACWIRSFFLYPVLLALVLWVLHMFLTRQFQAHKLILLVALLPIGLQFYATWQRTGVISYIDPSEAAIHQGMILSEKASGYDTVLPGVGFRSYPACESYLALGDALKSFDLYSIGCLMSGKINYYLGSYSPKTFWDPEKGSAEIPHSIQTINLYEEIYTEMIDGKEKPIFKFKKIATQQDAEIFYTAEFKSSSKYFPSFMAWSKEKNQFLLGTVRSHNDKVDKMSFLMQLQKNPQPLTIGTYLHSDGQFDIAIKFPYVSSDINEETQRLTADGSSINQGEIFLSDIKLEEAEFKHERFWSLGLLATNLFAIFCAMLLIQQNRKTWSCEEVMAFFLATLCCAEALVITPEQRFIIAPMIFIWILCIAYISRIILQGFLRSPHHGSV